MVRVQYIKKKGEIYYYQRRTPKALLDVYGKEWIRFSLKTDNVSEAVHRADAENQRIAMLLKADNPKTLFEYYTRQIQEHGPTENVREFGGGKITETHSAAEDLQEFIESEVELAGRNFDEVIASLNPKDQARWYAARHLERGERPPSVYRYSLRDACEELMEIKKRTVKSKTLGVYKRALEAYLGGSATYDLASITRPMVVEWYNEQLKTNNPKTVSNWMVYLGQMYQHAIDTGKIDESRANVFRGHRAPKHRTEHYQEMSQEQLLTILPLLKEDDQIAAQVGWYTGMRISEVLSATIESVDNILCFHVSDGKTAAATRWIPMHTALIPMLGAAEQATEITGDYSKRFGRAKSKAYPDAGRSLGFHSLRVAFISHALRAGHAEADVARVVGHEGAKGQLETGRTYYRGQTLAQMQDIVEDIPRLSGTLQV